jgi:AbrB family looped-hinge helix DNA binding protein
MKTTVDRFGRVVLPKKVRDALGLVPGSSLEVDAEENAVRLRPVTEESMLAERSGVLVFEGTASGDVAGAVNAQREARIRLAGGMERP